ncbi:ABC transporter substrate-binding protein [Arsenicicoccus sp. UBA7492]|uniref:ABC transporter substrate-binding protein n=1 Tax=Arsenicicoccus sp. UBA7492 TaxID=1946057 RepID=UPI0025803887|nr:ABC transporter substrate-binding protein [Arsenicicoccus sp. UBA7492]
MTITRRSLLTAAGLTSVLALAACGGGSGSGSDQVVRSSTAATPAGSSAGGDKATVGLTYIPNIQFAPFYVGIEQGYFRKRGADVTVRHHGAQEGLFTAIASGQEDLVIAGGDEMVEARAKGLDLVAVASYYRRYPVELIVPADSPIKTPADLKGRSLGVPGRYGESWLGALAMFKAAGITDQDVRVTEIGYTSQAALATDKVDAVMGYANNDTVQMRLAGLDVRSIPLTATGEVPLVSISLVTTRKYLQANPARVRAVADGMLDGIQTMASDPEQTIKDSSRHVPNLADAKAATAACATLDATVKVMLTKDGAVSGRLDPAQWASMTAFMRSQGLIAKDVPAADAVAAGYVSR